MSVDLEDDVVSGLRAVCGTEPAHWSAKASVMQDLRQRQPFWEKWQAAGFDSKRLSSLIGRLRVKHLNAGEQGETSGKRKASPASAGGACKVRKPSVASDEQKARVQAVLCKTCGEECDLWSTKKWVVEAVQCSSVGVELQAAGATVAQLQALIGNLKAKGRQWLCEHGRQKAQCGDCKEAGCGGSQLCDHGRRKAQCGDCKEAGCGGSQLCEHGRHKAVCGDCYVIGKGGSSLCGCRWGKDTIQTGFKLRRFW